MCNRTNPYVIAWSSASNLDATKDSFLIKKVENTGLLFDSDVFANNAHIYLLP